MYTVFVCLTSPFQNNMVYLFGVSQQKKQDIPEQVSFGLI